MANGSWARLLCAVTAGAVAVGAAGSALAESRSGLGPFGPESPRMREQLWVLPGGDPSRNLRATVFRPDDAPGEDSVSRPLAVINHGTASSTRLSVSMPVYFWLSKWFVDRGYVVVLPQRRGHGATGGDLDEAIGNCAHPDHVRSGQVAADDIAATVDFMTRQPGIAPGGAVVVGISTGGWASLALAARNPLQVRAIVNIAGGRGGHAGGQPNAVCGEKRLIEAAGEFGRTARIPTLWLYSENDSYFGPRLAASMAKAWSANGAEAEFGMLPAYGADGHDIANDRAGWDLWGAITDRFLAKPAAAQVAETIARDVSAEPSILPAGDGR
jgi:dienelactone hydrolase